MKQIFTCLCLFLFLAGSTAAASSARKNEKRERSHFTLPTGNGHGFQLFDVRQNRLVGMLDHPYRYLRAPLDLTIDGPERRNLMESFDFGWFEQDGDLARWLRFEKNDDTQYVEQTNLIQATSGGGRALYFAPFGLEANAFVGFFEPRAEQSTVMARLVFHLGGNPVSKYFWDSPLEVIKIPGETIEAREGYWVESGHGLGEMLYFPLQKETRGFCEELSSGVLAPHSADICSARDLGLILRGQGPLGVLVVYNEFPEEHEALVARVRAWMAGRSGEQIRADSLAEWRAWRTTPPESIRKDEMQARLWRQSEAVLRMGQLREANIPGVRVNNGMMLASLAPGHWATGWVRDGAYATVALVRSGHLDEAKRSLDFFLNAEPVGLFKDWLDGYPYRISVTRYYGNGREEADYSGQPSPNIETDGWGLVLWAARQYLDATRDGTWLTQATRDGTVYEVLRDGVARAIESQIDPELGVMKPDSSIWEVHQHRARHFAYTTLTAARGLCDFASIAKRAGEFRDHQHFRNLALRVREAFLEKFKAPEGHLIGALERTPDMDYDGSLLEAYSFDLFGDQHRELAEKTLSALEVLRLPSGGYQRTAGIEPYEANEWSFIDFRMVHAQLRFGSPARARELLRLQNERAVLNFELFPEMYSSMVSEGPIGAYTGAIPMVGYGAGAWIMATLEEQGYREARDCE